MPVPDKTLRQLVDPEVAKSIDDLITARIDEKADALLSKFEGLLADARNQKDRPVADRATIVVFSGDMDKALAAFVIATGALAMEMEVSMFFTFWGLSAIRKTTTYRGKSFSERMVSVMLPSGPEKLGTSKMNLLGFGPTFFKSLMRKKNIESLPDLIALAREMGVRLVACEMSLDVMGIHRDELVDGVDFGGVSTYLADASDSKITLFI